MVPFPELEPVGGSYSHYHRQNYRWYVQLYPPAQGTVAYQIPTHTYAIPIVKDFCHRTACTTFQFIIASASWIILAAMVANVRQ